MTLMSASRDWLGIYPPTVIGGRAVIPATISGELLATCVSRDDLVRIIEMEVFPDMIGVFADDIATYLRQYDS